MVNTFNNYKVGTKILIGYVIALALMAAVIIIALGQIQRINDTVVDLAEGLAAEQHIADQVVANVWATHFYALQYMDQQNPADLGRYRAEYVNFDQLLTMADQHISKQERLVYLDTIKQDIRTYGDDFTQVIDLLTRRNRDLLVDLDQQGRLAEIKLEQIRANSFFADDTVTSYQAGNVQRALLLMRVAAFQYLESGDLYWIDEFNRAYESAQTSFQKLDEAIQSQLYQELADDAKAAVDTYARSFGDIQKNYTEQQEIITDRLNVVGPAIREAGAAISADVATDFQAAAAGTQTLAARTQWLLLVTMGLAILAALGAGLVIARSITGPLQQVTDVARQIADLDLRKLTSEMDAIAQGDLARHLTITTRAMSIRSGDEIGQMARAFNAIIRQLQKAGVAFSDMAGNLRALTERNARLFEQAQTARQNAEAASQAKSNFLASMSHELRTPLNAILGYAQILRRDQSLPSSHADGLAVIEESGQHLLTLINDILDLAKIEAGKLSLQPTAVHLPTFLESVVGMMQLRAQEKGLQLDYERAGQFPAGVEVDEKRLRQVLINLLSNAIKFTPSGTVTLRAEIVETPKEKNPPQNQTGYRFKRVRFSVSDTGIGLKSSHLGLIFQPFEQLSVGWTAVEGTGLGLPISQQLIQAMGSEIQVESEEGHGSTFWFVLTLPVLETTLPAKPLPTRRLIGYTGPRQKILIVDDKRYNLALLVNFLAPLGFNVITARNGREAVGLAAQERPHLIILDMLMPVKSGEQTIQEIRRHPDIEATLIIGTSASVNSHPPQAAYDDFLPKPVDFDLLTELLSRHLQLTWLFEEEKTRSAGDKPTNPSVETSELIPPPPPELNRLYDLAMKGNMPGIYKRAVEIEQMSRQYHPFSHQLQKLAKAFDEESVLALITPYLKTSSS